MFYVYLHKKLTNGEIFYVGKGKGRRAYDRHKRSEYWNRVVNKYDLEVEILFDNLTEEEAFQCEKDTILELRYFGFNLVNMTDGGEGASGYKRSKEAIENTRRLHLGKKRSVETVEKLRLANIGKKHSEETKQLMRLNNLKNPPFIDKNEYLFCNKNGDLFIGTRKQLSNKFNFNPQAICNLFLSNKPARSAKGWYVITPNILMILCLLINYGENTLWHY